MIWTRARVASKAKLQKEFFLMEQKKTESINQFAGRVEQ